MSVTPGTPNHALRGEGVGGEGLVRLIHCFQIDGAVYHGFLWLENRELSLRDQPLT
jgi:hypothetical protein